jgi:hypothetical protein
VSVTPSIEARGVGKAVTDLHKVGERGSDVRRVSEKVRSVYRDSNRKRFAGYARWKALDEDTLERKRRAGQDTRINRQSGALEKSLTAARANDQIDVREPTVLRFGSTLFYARWQDKGTKTQPKRKLIAISKRDKEKIIGLIERFVARNQA